MKSIVLLLFVIGIMFVTIAYHKELLKNAKTQTIIEYRYLPRSFYEEQLQPSDVHHTFHDMFDKESVFFQTV
jgi:hypothetical protein